MQKAMDHIPSDFGPIDHEKRVTKRQSGRLPAKHANNAKNKFSFAYFRVISGLKPFARRFIGFASVGTCRLRGSDCFLGSVGKIVSRD
jgi:hypothetical protein